MKGVSSDRWRASQRLELDFWKRWTTAVPYRNLDVPKYWAEELTRFGCTREIFDERRVLDVGCGPYGLIHFLDNAVERVRVDPLLADYEDKMALEGRQLSIAAMGERLPLPPDSMDVAICFNALDHMLHPGEALRELRRVLRAGGTLLLMIHTFPAWAAPFFGVDRLHPHHWTAAGFTDLVGGMFSIEHMITVRRRFEVPVSKWILPSSWKYLAGNLVVASTYVRARR